MTDTPLTPASITDLDETPQVGDVVQCIDDTPLTWSTQRIERGRRYEVEATNSWGGLRVDGGGSIWWVPSRFLLVLRAGAEQPAGTPEQAEADPVNHPAHYRLSSGVEVIDLTEQLDFLRGNAVKYLARAGRKDGADELEDLKKAQWYVTRAVTKLEQERTA